MRKIHHELGHFFVGEHARIGLLIYDDIIQRDLGDLWVRFYSVQRNDWACFLKEKVRPELVAGPIAEDDFNRAVQTWTRVKPRITSFMKRKAACHRCSSALALSTSTLCLSCAWLKCNQCGACGCDSHRHSSLL